MCLLLFLAVPTTPVDPAPRYPAAPVGELRLAPQTPKFVTAGIAIEGHTVRHQQIELMVLEDLPATYTGPVKFAPASFQNFIFRLLLVVPAPTISSASAVNR